MAVERYNREHYAANGLMPKIVKKTTIVKSDDQENLLNFDMPIQIPKILESKAPTIVIDLSTFLCPSSS